MAKQKFGLGRGLDALISGASEVMSAQQQQQQTALPVSSEPVPLVPIESIMPNPKQPRRAFREDDPRLLELSASIKEHGLIQPIVVTRMDVVETPEPDKEGDPWLKEDAPSFAATTGNADAPVVVQYQIIAGERRWRASRLAGLTKVPVVIKDVTPLQMLEMALIENIQRADLNPIEEALAYQALIQEFGLTQELVAKQVGKDRSTVTNSLRLLQLAPKVRDALINQSENFSEGHARALVGITNEENQVTAMSQIIALHLNVRQAEELASRIKAAQDIESAVRQIAPASHRSPDQESLESHFREALMVKVDLKYNAKGKGTLVLHFNSQDELEGLYSRLVKKEE
ncbi:MAG TPA: ParB/RepB/Spo0J family partition protein [Ktedonobacteraceae bacterium]|nr:ParB/RepB/Spo0J family partition protein [Ktedonobacteraceae bacterium]